MFQFLPDGSRVFRVRFDVHEFAPEELSVQTDSGQLMVRAKQSVTSAAGQRRREMNKTIDLPDDVDVERLVSRLANDGVLTVEAPANPPTYQAVIRSRDTNITANPQTQKRHVIEQTASARTDHLQMGTQIISTGQLYMWVYFAARHE